MVTTKLYTNSGYSWKLLLLDMVVESAKEEAKEKTSTIARRKRLEIRIEGLDELHLVEATENENGDGVGPTMAGDGWAAAAAVGETAAIIKTPLPSFI